MFLAMDMSFQSFSRGMGGALAYNTSPQPNRRIHVACIMGIGMLFEHKKLQLSLHENVQITILARRIMSHLQK